MNRGPKIVRGSFYVSSRLNTEIPMRELSDDEALQWVQDYQARCRGEIAQMPWWAWSRRRYLHAEIVHGDLVSSAIRANGISAVEIAMLASVGVHI